MEGTVPGQHGTSSTANNDFWLWDDVLQNDSLPFFDMEPAPQWKYQNNFDDPNVKQAMTNGETQVPPGNAKALKPEPG